MIKRYSGEEIKNIIDPNLYQKIPIEYIIYLSIQYSTGDLIIISKNEISTALHNHSEYIDIKKLYRTDKVSEIEIELDFDNLAEYVNSCLDSLFPSNQ